MKLLLKQVIITDKNSPYNGQQKDILIEGGKIVSIKDDLSNEDAQNISYDNLFVSPGWVDIFSHFCDPGYEHRETVETGALSAAAGGYTTVFTLPNTNPVVCTKSQVEYIIQKCRDLPVTILPLGAITKNADGKELAEMYDMLNSGAVAFSDGLKTVESAGLFLKALQYVKAFDGVLIQVPNDKSVGSFGLMNEGIMSTRLGLPGIPAIGEEIMISRDIELAAYTNSRLHITGVSTARSIELICKAKANGIAITCSVTPYHLFFCDEDLADYDTNLKVDPPLRTRADMMALRQAVTDGKVDSIATHHIPHDTDNKICEFEYAKPGMIGLQTCFQVFNTLFPNIDTIKLVELFSHNNRQIFNLAPATIKEGMPANLTLFSKENLTSIDAKNNKSKSRNTAFTGHQLMGRVIGIINKDQLYLN